MNVNTILIILLFVFISGVGMILAEALTTIQRLLKELNSVKLFD